MGKGKISIAGLQFAGLQYQKESNRATAERMIRQAAMLGAQLVMTPEVVLTGFVGGTEERKMAEPVPGPATTYFGHLARELDVYVLLGLSELYDQQFYNTMVVIGRDGSVMGVMRKVHINRYETGQGWRNGSQFPVWHFETATGSMTAGIMICYDREVPESARILMLKDADLILNPLACFCPTVDIHRCLLRTRAFENEMHILVVNHAAPRFNGHSMFINFQGDIVNELNDEEGILMADINLDALVAYRQHGIYGKHHRRPELYSILLNANGKIHPGDANLP